MTQAVHMEGFAPPPASTMVPGFVPPAQSAATQTAEPAPAQGAQPQQSNDALATAIAALTSALSTQQPATPAVQEQATIQGVPASLNDFDVAGMDDPILKSMATVMQTVGKGIDMDRALGKAIQNGRVDLIDVAYIREKGGENADQLVTIAQGLVNAIEAKSAASTAKVHNLAGGEQNWNASIAAFNIGAPLELRTVVGQMLDSGKENLIEAGAKLIVEFGKGKSGLLPEVGRTVNGGAASLPAAQALSKEQFQTELRKLNTNDRTYESARGELFSRRQLGKQLGL